MSEDSTPHESTVAGYEDVAAHFQAHQQQEGHRLRRRAHDAFGGVPAFLVPTQDGRRVACCDCIRGS
ncbi:hypothetical protein ACQEU8_16740 [Streptomyces sp. CA-250714]|uniref:hypothetical protein n=1 Tax=Streptomyces sp. CA-250714 TaxID=3240060 RepID=UPI003D8C01EA